MTNELSVTIATAPNGLSVHKELRLVKAVLLYADTVQIYSPSATMIDNVAALTNPTRAEKLAFIIEIAPLLGRPELSEQLLTATSGIESMRDERQRVLARLGLNRTIDHAWEPLAARAEELADAAGMKELAYLAELGIVNLLPLGVPVDASGDELVGAMTEQLTTMLTMSTSYPLFDDGTSGLVRALVREHRIDVAPSAQVRSRKATTAAAFIGRLPSFEDAELLALLEARDTVRDHVGRFRSAIRDVGASFESGPFSEALQDEINEAWIEVVQPELDNIEGLLRDAGFVRALLRQVATDTPSTAASMLAVGSMAIEQLPTILGAAGLAVPVAKAVLERHDQRRTAGANRWFLLHQAERYLNDEG